MNIGPYASIFVCRQLLCPLQECVINADLYHSHRVYGVEKRVTVNVYYAQCLKKMYNECVAKTDKYDVVWMH